MDDLARNSGIVSLNRQDLKASNKTVVVIGVSRSGTSMVTSALEHLGVFMGKVKNDIDFEDQEIFKSLENSKNDNAFQKLVRERNSKYKIWGWKRPDAIRYLGKFEDKITNPHYIIMFRDSAAIALRNSISYHIDVLKNLHDTHVQYSGVIHFLQTTKKPCLIISYEKAILDKDQLIKHLISFLNLSATTKQVNAAKASIEPNRKKYLASTRQHEIRGFVNQTLNNGSLKGWIQKVNSTNPVEIDIFLNKKLIHTMLANEYRKDLDLKGIGNGFHGFTFTIPALPPKKKGAEIRVVARDTKYELINSPLRISTL